MSHAPKKVGILVGGGPAPGINAVIGAATIRAVLAGSEVVGILDGFSYLMKGNIDHVRHLSINDVSRIHFRGGLVPRHFKGKPHEEPGAPGRDDPEPPPA